MFLWFFMQNLIFAYIWQTKLQFLNFRGHAHIICLEKNALEN